MQTAKIFADLSHARRLHVGAIVVKNDRIISIGYNGMPAGWDNNCEDEAANGSLTTKPEVLHAEMNALMKLAKSTESGNGATMFLTHSPCVDCAKGMFQAGISEVFYGEQYRSNDGLEFLEKCGIKVKRVSK